MSVGIIAEYNPFHNGHKYQLEQAKLRFPNEKIIVILSGKYVQRGEIAIVSFDERKQIALQYGADEVIELPFEYASQAAHIFAEGAIKLINKLGIDKIFFGSESNDGKLLMQIAQTIKDNLNSYNLALKSFLKKGYSFPKSSNEALKLIANFDIQMPNDILGLEYCKAIVNNDFKIKVYTLKRTIDFHANEPMNQFASASYIRKSIKEGKDVSQYTPMDFKNKTIDYIENYYFNFQQIINSKTNEEIANIKLVSEGMENLFKKNIGLKTYDEFVEECTSRRYTSSRIKRVMLYILLNIKK